MKINQVYTALSLSEKEPGKEKSKSRRKSSWLASGRLTIRKKDAPTFETSDPASNAQRANTLLHTADLGQALREAIPEVEVSKKRRSMPHMSMKRTLLSIRFV
jgi:hypothetical protein